MGLVRGPQGSLVTSLSAAVVAQAMEATAVAVAAVSCWVQLLYL
jgi:hypothetical protein